MKIEKKLLEIGDRLCYKWYDKWGQNCDYSFATVERLTKTQAILSDGTKLINAPEYVDYKGVIVGYPIYGDRWEKWQFETQELIEEYKVENERRRIENWFSKRVFSDEEKKIIYLKFKELNLLEQPK